MKFSLLLLLVFGLLMGSLRAQDSAFRQRRTFDTSLFVESEPLTRSDYLSSLEKSFNVFNKVPVRTSSFIGIPAITRRLKEDDSALAIIKDRISGTERGINLKNLQMFSALLEELEEDSRKSIQELNNYDANLDSLKKEIRNLRKDSTVRHIFRDSILRESFKPQLQQLRTKYKNADSLVKANTAIINYLEAQLASNIILIQELQFQATALLKMVGARAFTKERRYIWEPRTGGKNRFNAEGFRKNIKGEKFIAQYYFENTRKERTYLFLLGAIFFCWIFYNFRSLKKINRLQALQSLHIHYINRLPILPSLLFVLSLAPLFDPDAPAIYFETIEFLLMLTLTAFLWKRIPRVLFFLWVTVILLYLVFSMSRLMGLPYGIYRYWVLTIHSVSFALGLMVALKLRTQWSRYKIFSAALVFYLLFNLLAAFSNIFGRVTLMQIFGSTANYALVQTIGLYIFVKLVTESFLLQIQASRIRKQYPENFDHISIERVISRYVSILAVVIWLVVITSNLNLYSTIIKNLEAFLTKPRVIGKLPFTYSGIILFLGIIWAANFLQKNIAYFWGDTGDEAAFDNKGQRSKLLITRLILLTGGFLLAVAASGLPIDKITVILGALSVGIGLGLQGIVNNFVSGIILIFDRPLRIGDIVEVGDKKGRVKEIGVRSSTLLTAEGSEIIIPNGDLLSHNIVNWTLSNNHIRMELSFKLEKPFDAAVFRKGITEIIKESENNLQSKKPEILINNVSSSTAEVKVYFWCKDVSRTEYAKSDIRDAIQNLAEENGIKLI
jgi:potassium efflux system protein